MYFGINFLINPRNKILYFIEKYLIENKTLIKIIEFYVFNSIKFSLFI